MSVPGRVLSFVRIDGHLVRVSIRGEGPPLLLIMGLARILAGRIPNAELEIVPDAGHLLLMDRADRVGSRIATFLGLAP
jgi:pimeloyl-ACP methyl ester carboxylesterase